MNPAVSPHPAPEPGAQLADAVLALPAEPATAPAQDAGRPGVLLVEDEDALRRLTARILERAGYRVVQARSGAEAVELVGGSDASVRLLVTDVVMPLMSGRDLAAQLLAERSELKVIYTSGYGAEILDRHGLASEHVAFLQKPFNVDELLQVVRETLAA